MNIAFLSSYNGSAAHAITDACLSGDIIASPVLLITNNPKASALEWAENKGLKTAVMNRNTHSDIDALDQAIADKLQDHKINLVCCSGYMKLIGKRTIDAVQGRILNVHPALLPQYGGQGMYGRHVHEAVKQSGDKQTGATIHQVNNEYDKGKILLQKTISIQPTDTTDIIEQNVKDIEPSLYIETISRIIKGDITLD